MNRLLVAGGGTGGHVYPLLAVVEALRRQEQDAQVLFLGRPASVEERLARKQGLPFSPIAAGAVRGKGPVRAAVSMLHVFTGTRAALGAIQRFGPEAVLVTGGYVSVPVALASSIAQRPLVVCLPDMEPGMAVRLLARLAQTVTVSFEEVRHLLPPGKAVVTGYPVRAAFFAGQRAEARARLGLALDGRVLVVLGGSSGARNLNNAVLAVLPDLLELGTICHITGPLDWERVRARREALDTCVREQYRIYSYVEDDMGRLLRAADLVVARAGAATLGELPAVGVPSLLVPGDFAGGHQAINARFLEQHGAAEVLADSDLSRQFLSRVRALLCDPARLAAMAEAARRLARPNACEAIVAELARVARPPS
ncbi:MAG: undecaprenyldiphospho-muramoylpentapeptide beta-N-acetylglucosaminyltransferase [Anaerolineae bacterium]